MSPSPSLLMTLIVILSTVLGLTLVVLSWVVVRLRAAAGPGSGQSCLTSFGHGKTPSRP